MTTLPTWLSKRRGLIANCTVYGVHHTEVADEAPDRDFQESVIRAVSLDTKHVTAARDQSGNPIGKSRYRPRDTSDSLIIRRLISDDSKATAKAETILRTKDIDRIFGEMSQDEKIEFFWCEFHGLMHESGSLHRVYAGCMHCAPKKITHHVRDTSAVTTLGYIWASK